MSLQLTIRRPEGQYETKTIEKEVAVVGRREGSDIVLPYQFVSSRHCRFFRQGAHIFVEDLGSTNGVQVNGETLTPQVPCSLKQGDVVVIGKVEVRAQWIEEAEVIGGSEATMMEVPGAATVIEQKAAVSQQPPYVPRTTTAPQPIAAPLAAAAASRSILDSDAPATMWEIQTGVYGAGAMRVDDHRVGSVSGNVAVAPRPAFQASSGAAAPVHYRESESDRFQVWSVFFQALGLGTLFAAVVLLVIVLFS